MASTTGGHCASPHPPQERYVSAKEAPVEEYVVLLLPVFLWSRGHAIRTGAQHGLAHLKPLPIMCSCMRAAKGTLSGVGGGVAVLLPWLFLKRRGYHGGTDKCAQHGSCASQTPAMPTPIPMAAACGERRGLCGGGGGGCAWGESEQRRHSEALRFRQRPAPHRKQRDMLGTDLQRR